MEGTLHFTPLDMKKLDNKPVKEGFNSLFNTILLILVTFTASIISIVLFLLIKKNHV